MTPTLPTRTAQSRRSFTESALTPALDTQLSTQLGIHAAAVYHDPSVPELYQHALRRGEGILRRAALWQSHQQNRPQPQRPLYRGRRPDAGTVWWGGFNTTDQPGGV